MKLNYVIKFVADMNRAVKFYRDVLGLALKFESPDWSEFITGETTLALHPVSEESRGRWRVGLHSSRHSKLPSRNESEGRSVQHATNETRLRRLTRAVRGLRRRTLQRRRTVAVSKGNGSEAAICHWERFLPETILLEFENY